jgi:hypothetical protein
MHLKTIGLTISFLLIPDVLSPLSSPPSPLRLTLFSSPVSPVSPVLDSSLHSLMPASYFASGECHGQADYVKKQHY